VQYIIKHYDQKTKRNEYYKTGDKRLAGFNSIFATASIDIAKKYYLEFKKQMAELPSDKKLKIAIIYSFAVNEDEEVTQGLIGEENLESTLNLDYSSRDFLDSAIKEYNAMFNVNFDTSSEKFQNYYKDVSQRVKDRELDLLIVVNMFLTGFDATTLNTLWVDKNLRMHGLLQAFSRTNRILNTIKTFGNIVCFRNLERQTNESISLFGNKEARGIVLLKTFDEYYNGYLSDGNNIKGYVELIEELQDLFPVDKMITGEENKKEFIKLYNTILMIKNILTTFDEFEGKEILSPRDFQDYHSKYIDIYNELGRGKKGEAENINDDLIFEMELIKQVEINIDHILDLVEKYQKSNMNDKEIVINITKAIDSSIELRNKKQLIESFLAKLSKGDNVQEKWDEYVILSREEELNEIIEEENLQQENTIKLIENAFRDGVLQITGTTITDIMPAIPRFNRNIDRTGIINNVIDKLNTFFNRFFGI
jgi:type I restriction enzyme R subunit